MCRSLKGSSATLNEFHTLFLIFNTLLQWHLAGLFSLMSYMAIWIRRTGVMTTAELLRIRFGGGGSGEKKEIF